MLLALPAPIFLNIHTTTKRKVQLWVLFSLGIFLIAITIIRLPLNHKYATSQINRTTWASIELLTSAIVVNTPILYGLAKRTRVVMSAKQSSVALHNVQQPRLPESHKGRLSVFPVEELEEQHLTAAAMRPVSPSRSSSRASTRFNELT